MFRAFHICFLLAGSSTQQITCSSRLQETGVHRDLTDYMTTPPSPVSALLVNARDYVRAYMSDRDSSHDFKHVQRVVRNAQQILRCTTDGRCNVEIVMLASWLHDVGDAKYLKPGEDGSKLAQEFLLSMHAETALADEVQTIINHVSYSKESRAPQSVVDMVARHPELAVVQDADRLDALGAIGIGRCFAFGGARDRTMQDSLKHFHEKLYNLESMMKSPAGKEIAKVRADRLRMFERWWKEEEYGSTESRIL